MDQIRRRVTLGLAAGLAGCSANLGAAFGPTPESLRPVAIASLPKMRITRTVVTVPERLTISEANSFKPTADIVWHGDPPGDRYAQIKTIFEAAAARTASRMQGDLPVVVFIEVTRFHAVSQRTRYTLAGRHEIGFDLQVNNAATGAIVVPRYPVDASFPALGGDEAAMAENAGITQKARISDQLSARLLQELTGAPVEDIAPHPVATDG